MSLLTDYDAMLLDLDGTVWEGGRAIPGAVDVINTADLPTVYVTNNAARAAEVVASRLQGIGLPASAADVLTSAQAAVELAVADVPAESAVLVLGTDSFRQLAEQAGFRVVESADDEPVAVLQGHNPETGWAQLSEAALAIRAGARYIASNLDSSLPSERGLLVGNGSMVAAVVSATGVTPLSAGKPGPAMFHSAAGKLDSKRPLVVGDRLDTDIEGGVTAGMDTFQVLTGVSGPKALLAAPLHQRPVFIGESMTDLSREGAELRVGPQGGFTARIDGAELVLSGGGPEATSIHALRTALAVTWDSGGEVTTIRGEGEAAEEAVAAWW
ncbi:HAD-IIA family hydrolase [Corynebacterium halotolerans]|uniref:HAD-IIA family hydrolase n=1 Tax=Corynebacterium halotolerans TaxID=225326 RepID=UPI003CECA052